MGCAVMNMTWYYLSVSNMTGVVIVSVSFDEYDWRGFIYLSSKVC